MVNRPEEKISSEHIDAVVQFFFKRFRDLHRQKLKDIKKALPEHLKAADIPIEMLRALYEKGQK